MECSTTKAPLEGHFFVVLSISTSVKVAEIVPWIHHSQMKAASLSRSAASLCKITLWNAHTLPQQDPDSQKTIGDHGQRDAIPSPLTLEAD
jgi:hypothetical protein